MPHWFLGLSSLVSSFFSFSLISLISYLLLFLKSDRSLVPNCCSDLTPTQAIKSSEAIVGTWTTGGRMGRQISFRIFFYPLLFICFLSQFIYDYPFSLQHSHLFFLSLWSSPFFVLFIVLPSLLSVSLFLPSPSLSWLTRVGETGQFVLPGSKITCLSVWMWRSTDDFCSPISNRGSCRSNEIKISIVCIALSLKKPWELLGLFPEMVSKLFNRAPDGRWTTSRTDRKKAKKQKILFYNAVSTWVQLHKNPEYNQISILEGLVTTA